MDYYCKLNGEFLSFSYRFALLEAMKKGDMSTIELCMQCSGFMQFLPVVLPALLPSASPDSSVSSSLARLFLKELSFGLYVLASNGNFSLVMELFQQMHAVILELQ